MFLVLTILSAVQVLAVSGSYSYVCGAGGNFSSVQNWTRISSKLMDNLDNPFQFQAVLDTYSEILDWVGADGDYWGEESACVEQLIVQTMDEEVLEQSGPFAAILTVDMLDWSNMFGGEGGEAVEILVDKTREIIEKLRKILENIQSSLKTSPEQSALLSLDTVMVSMMSILGMVGKAVDFVDNEMMCQIIQMTTEDLLELESLVDFDIQGSSFNDWPEGVALCSHDLPETYDSCQPPLPYPFYWVQDNYLGTQLFFGEQEQAEVFMSKYLDSVQTSVDSMVKIVQLDLHMVASIKNTMQMLLPVYCV